DLHAVEDPSPVAAAERRGVGVDAPLAAGGGGDLERVRAARGLVGLHRRAAVLGPTGGDRADGGGFEALADDVLARATRGAAQPRAAAAASARGTSTAAASG